MANFNKDYVKTSVFPREMWRKIGQAEEIRHASDYDDFYIASKEESERQISVADEFIILAEKYLWNSLKNKRKIEMNEDAPQGLKPWGIFYVKVYYSNKRNGCSTYHNGNIIAEEIPPELLSYMEEVLPEKKELDTEIVLDTMINVNEFLKN